MQDSSKENYKYKFKAINIVFNNTDVIDEDFSELEEYDIIDIKKVNNRYFILSNVQYKRLNNSRHYNTNIIMYSDDNINYYVLYGVGLTSGKEMVVYNNYIVINVSTNLQFIETNELTRDIKKDLFGTHDIDYIGNIFCMNNRLYVTDSDTRDSRYKIFEGLTEVYSSGYEEAVVYDGIYLNNKYYIAFRETNKPTYLATCDNNLENIELIYNYGASTSVAMYKCGRYIVITRNDVNSTYGFVRIDIENNIIVNLDEVLYNIGYIERIGIDYIDKNGSKRADILYTNNECICVPKRAFSGSSSIIELYDDILVIRDCDNNNLVYYDNVNDKIYGGRLSYGEYIKEHYDENTIPLNIKYENGILQINTYDATIKEYPLFDFIQIIKFNTGRGLRAIRLTSIDSDKASPVRIMTLKGLQAFEK